MNEHPSFDLRAEDPTRYQSCLPSPLVQEGKEDAAGMVWLCFKVALALYLVAFVGLVAWPR